MQAYIPELTLVGIALILLMLDTFLKKAPKWVLGVLGVIGTTALLPQYMMNMEGNLFIILALVATILTLLLAIDFRKVINESSNDSQSQEGTGELFILQLLACAGIMALCESKNLIALFVSLEILTLSSYIMAGYFRRNLGSTEAGIKYLILGATSTGLMVFGMAWYFGMTGTFDYNAGVIATACADPQLRAPLLFSLGLMLLGTAFKIGAFPMQMWIPDVYQGAPTPVTAFLSVASKVAGFALLTIIIVPFTPFEAVRLTVAIIAAATLLIGNLGAIPQNNLKRLLGYSSIAQAGFILPFFMWAPHSLHHLSGSYSAMAYLAIYTIMTMGAFFALATVRTQRGSDAIDAFRGLSKTNPKFALATVIMFASLAGVPCTAGFLAKMMSFVYVVSNNLYLIWLLPIMIICAGAGFYYYFKVIRAMYWETPTNGDTAALKVSPLTGCVLLVCSAILLIVGIMPLFTVPMF